MGKDETVFRVLRNKYLRQKSIIFITETVVQLRKLELNTENIYDYEDKWHPLVIQFVSSDFGVEYFMGCTITD